MSTHGRSIPRKINMGKFKVKSGEFEVIVHEESPRLAGGLAIKLHNKSKQTSKLGELTLIFALSERSKQVGEGIFFATVDLIKSVTDVSVYSKQ